MTIHLEKKFIEKIFIHKKKLLSFTPILYFHIHMTFVLDVKNDP